MLWFVMSVMTGLAVVAALWPLAFRRQKTAAPSSEAGFFRAQLAEIERDVERGQLPVAEAASARVEAARRLIAASAAEGQAKPAKGSLKDRRIAAVAILVAVPLVALGVYLELGRPTLPMRRLPNASPTPPLPTPSGSRSPTSRLSSPRILTMRADGACWRRSTCDWAASTMRSTPSDNSSDSTARALKAKPTSAKRCSRRLAASSRPTRARAFEQALQLQADLPKARFYLGLAAEQDGDDKKALAIYRELEPQTDGSEAWMVGLKHRLAALGAGASPNFSPEQEAMIREMVEGLATRLSQSGGSAEEWARLIRAYSVLKDLGKAKTALTDAREKFSGDAATLRRFDSLARELGL